MWMSQLMCSAITNCVLINIYMILFTYIKKSMILLDHLTHQQIWHSCLTHQQIWHSCLRGFYLFLLVISQAKRFGRFLYPHKITEKNNYAFLTRIWAFIYWQVIFLATQTSSGFTLIPFQPWMEYPAFVKINSPGGISDYCLLYMNYVFWW